MQVNMQKYHKELMYIQNKEFGHIEDPVERHMAVMECAIYEFVKKRYKKK